MTHTAPHPGVEEGQQQPDFAALGAAMHGLAGELFPITRSLCGPGFRDTLDGLERVAGPMERHRFASGEEIWDWVVPHEWHVREAWIKGPSGSRVVDIADNNLHLISHSVGVHERLQLVDLQSRLHSLPEQPDAIPYRTSYYAETWGFCLTDRVRSSLPDGEYEVYIDAELRPGHLEVGEVCVGPAGAPEVLLSTYCCHPSMANNELSGPVVAAYLVSLLRSVESSLRHRYRVLFVPETMGPIAYLSRFGPELKERVVAGYVVTCVGDPGKFTYKRSRRGDSLADRVAEHVLRYAGDDHQIVDYFPLGSDERQYCAPAWDLPVGSLMRTQYWNYPEYHTSLDDLSFITPSALGRSLELYWYAVQCLEACEVLVNTHPWCEPRLGPRGLYPSTGGASHRERRLHDILWTLNMSDGTQDMLAIAERAGRPLWEMVAVVPDLLEHGLLARPASAA